MAETIFGIKADGTKDYTTLAAFDAAEITSIASGDQVVAEIYGIVTGASNMFNWPCADSTARLIIRPATGEKHTGTAGTGAKLTNSTTAGILTLASGGITTPNYTVQDMEVEIYTGSNDWGIFATDGPTAPLDIVVDSCIIYISGANFASGVEVFANNNAGSLTTVNNSVIYGMQYAVAGIFATNDQTVVNYCTGYGTGSQAFRYCTSTNCFAGNGAGYLSNAASSNYNISSDTTAPGANVLISKTDYASYFTTPGSDFSLLETTANGGIFGATGLAGTPIAGITVDILGVTRDGTNPDIGAFEFDGGAGLAAAVDSGPVGVGLSIGL